MGNGQVGDVRTLPEVIQDEYGDSLDALWKAQSCNNDDPLYLRFLPYHTTIRLLAEAAAATETGAK